MAVPTAPELADFSLACQRLWSLDHNRLEPGRDYTIALQVGTGTCNRNDHRTRLPSTEHTVRHIPGHEAALRRLTGTAVVGLQKTRRQVERDGPGGMTKLFSYVSPDALKRPTYLTFYNLLDNYERELFVIVWPMLLAHWSLTSFCLDLSSAPFCAHLGTCSASLGRL